MKYLIILTINIFLATAVVAQSVPVTHISKIEVKKKKRERVPGADSIQHVVIDTLIMHDRSSLQFYGKKEVTLEVKHAFIPKKAYISATDGKNNGSDMEITMRFDELGSLIVLAGGRDANNGSRTYPNGDGGTVTFNYLSDGVKPQSADEKQDTYLRIDTRAGGYSVNARSDLYNIYSRIGGGSRPLGQLPQGQVYSGSPGIDGESDIHELSNFDFSK
ncbi:hypothetical protein [Albibacterium indicum]|uniref:hypothetical protein n=1 Tax=Albibacterium indicum TaxID=2292082 RepID=UPI000E4910BA|nr:hypothetical protein [Pedobacter indicus]